MKVSVSIAAIKHNFSAVKALAGQAKICAVVKDDAYGHGLTAAAEALSGLADCFGVASGAEAARLREAGIASPVLIMGALSPDDAKILFESSIIQTVTEVEDLRFLEQIGSALNKSVSVHLKIDTGMNRLGIKDDREFEEALFLLESSKHLVCEGIFTHFATSDGSDAEFLEKQYRRFESFVARLKVRFPAVTAHCLSSGGLITAPEHRLDMVRPGLMLYGYSPVAGAAENLGLRPALTATASVAAVKTVAAGESISYGRTYTAEREKKTAVIRAGYGDGYMRSLSGRGYVIINGKRADILGRICMDMFVADASGIEVKRGDNALLLGEGASAEVLAELAGTIAYEILTNIKPRSGRVYEDN